MALFDSLNLSPVERLVAEYVPGLLNAGFNKNQIFNSLRHYAPDISRVQSGSLVDYARSVLRSNSIITASERNELINSTDFPPAPNILNRNYHIKVRAGVFNPELGVYEDRYITIATDTYTSEAAFFDSYGDLATRYFVDYALAAQGGFVDINSMHVFEGLQNPAGIT